MSTTLTGKIYRPSVDISRGRPRP